MKSTKQIRKELAIMIKKRIKTDIPADISDEEKRKHENRIVGECRQEMNKIHGKGWRERDDMKPRTRGKATLGDYFPDNGEMHSERYFRD